MIRFLLFTFFLPLTILAQSESHVLSFDVAANVDDRTKEISGSMHVALRIAGSLTSQYSFLVPKEWIFNSIRDHNNDSYDIERFSSERTMFDLITIELNEQQHDSLFLNIDFKAILDSLSSSSIFVNQREFLLPYSDSASWLPQFHASQTERFSLEIKLSPQFTLIAEELFDTISTDGMRTWKRSTSTPVLLSAAFTLCGLRNATQQTSISSDSLISISLFTAPAKFNQQYAAAVTRQINDAIQFFSSVTKLQHITKRTYAVVGSAQLKRNIFTTDRFVVLRNSPAYSRFDSSALTRSSYNHWITELAHLYTPMNGDSTALFDDGFASYLTTRFLVSTFPTVEKEERLSSIANTLTFFPDGNMASGYNEKTNTNEIAKQKGKYFFLMLEYLLSQASFDTVISLMSEQFSNTPVSLSEFQRLCEQEYGSSLNWFFDQWLNHFTAPEYIMQWKDEKTPRGMSIIRMNIEQRTDIFSMPVPIVFFFGNRMVTKRVFVEQPKQEFTFTFPTTPTRVELDPDYSILRWLLELRISAHAKTSLQYLSINRDIIEAEREALYTLQLDPNNSTGSAPLTYFVLGNIAALNTNVEKAKEYFTKASSSISTKETEQYTLLSLVRYANLLDNEGKRDEAVSYYQRVITESLRNPLIFERTIIEAEHFLLKPFNHNDDVWFNVH